MRGWELLGLARSQVDNLSIFEPAAPPSHAIRTLSILLFAISALIFVVVEGILVYNLLRFRVSASAPTANRRKSTAARRSKSPGPSLRR